VARRPERDHANAGALIAFWHDEPDYWKKKPARWRTHASLAAWASSARAALEAKPPQKPKAKPAKAKPPGEWKRVAKRPTAAALQKHEAGTLYLCRSFSWIQPHLSFRVFLKLDGDLWVEGIGGKLDSAFSEALQHASVGNPTRPSQAILGKLDPKPENDAPPPHMKHLKAVPAREIGLFLARV
jgi:hypothetical protein